MTSVIDFSFPSLHDCKLLQGRIHVPIIPQMRLLRAGAVVAHSYASLGGCQSDPVVSLLVRMLLSKGIVVGTFDFRGAGLSQGNTSWSAQPEQTDFRSFTHLFICYLERLLKETIVGTSQAIDHQRLDLILGGYSYGSMIASRAAPINDVYNIGTTSNEESIDARLSSLAQTLPLPISLQRLTIERSVGRLTLHTSYLLISPLMPPVSSFLALSVPSFGWGKIDKHQNLIEQPTLVIFGGRDAFASRQKLRVWTEALQRKAMITFEFEEIHDADHFWRETGVADRLRDRAAAWVRDVVLAQKAEE